MADWHLSLGHLKAQVEVNSTLTAEQSYVNDILLGEGIEASNIELTGSPDPGWSEITGFRSGWNFPIAGGSDPEHRGGQPTRPTSTSGCFKKTKIMELAKR